MGNVSHDDMIDLLSRFYDDFADDLLPKFYDVNTDDFMTKVYVVRRIFAVMSVFVNSLVIFLLIKTKIVRENVFHEFMFAILSVDLCFGIWFSFDFGEVSEKVFEVDNVTDNNFFRTDSTRSLTSRVSGLEHLDLHFSSHSSTFKLRSQLTDTGRFATRFLS